MGQRKVVVGKWRQLYLNNNKKKAKKKKKEEISTIVQKSCVSSPSLSAQSKCCHHGTDSAPMWNNLISLIMLEMLRKHFLGEKGEYGGTQN